MTLAPGTRLGPYVLQSLLGQGGMGEVYRAEDSRLQRTVAIKILSPTLATADRVQRFEQEARAASALNHPNILTIYDVGRAADTSYFAMEWVDGRTLRQLLNEGPIPLRRSITLAQQIAEGLARAHAAGIVHRDLKPENVMVTADGLAKIVDFGLAKVHAPATAPGDADPTVTRVGGTEPGVVMGTAGYMSPEQASGLPVDYRSDQFALGLLIYEMATRTRPFQRPTTAQSLAATIDSDPPPIDTLNPEVPLHLAAIVTRLLAKDPAERYESTRDLARDLKSAFESWSRPSGGASVDTRSRRVRWAPLAAIAALMILVTAATLWLTRPPTAAPALTTPAHPLLAVRPFSSLSADPQQGYFAAGITEEIRAQLSQLSSLRLLSRNGLDAYKDDVIRAVRELGVKGVVDGSVRVEGTRVRVRAELVDAATQQTLWSNQYDRELSDVLAVQSEIAQHIARALGTNLSPSDEQRLAKRLTENPEAYALYLKARAVAQFDRASNLESIALFRKAVALDPRFAAAQAQIGNALVTMGYYDDPSYIDQGITETEAALRIDPSLPFAHFVLATAYGMKGQVARARQAFLRTLELDPNNVGAMVNFSIEELNNGRMDEATYWGRRGFALSGRGGNAAYHLILPILLIRADAESRVLLEEAERRTPANPRIQMMLSMLELIEGQTDRAVARAETMMSRFPKHEEVRFFRADMAYLLDAPDLEKWVAPLMERGAANQLWAAQSARLKYAYALTKRGESTQAASSIAEAERVAQQKIGAGNEAPVLRVELATAAALRKDEKGALGWLERAYESGYRDYSPLERDPVLRAHFGSDARFTTLLDRMRRDVAAQRERARERGLFELTSLLSPAK
jgi:serine/threonine protein kinase/predicted Zn-dependent protease